MHLPDGLATIINENGGGLIQNNEAGCHKQIQRIVGRPTDVSATPSSKEIFSTLTEVEREIAQLVCKGLSNKQIGRRLNLSEGSVKVHVHEIYQKLAIRNRAALAAMATPSRK